MVMAKKYELQVKIQGSTAYQKDGQRKLIHDNKFIQRWWVEERNKHENNELYVVDEEATEAAYELQAKNIEENAEKAKRSKVSMADLVDSVVTGMSKKEKSEEPDETWKVKELKEYCDENEISYHHKAGKAKLIECINEQ